MEEQESTEEKKTDEQVTREAYLADLERFRDFTPKVVLWPSPIGPRWEN
jgi:hypothetical protein